MNALHAVVRQAVAWMLLPLAGLPPLVALLVWSLVFGVLAALAFRYTSNQDALRRVSDATRANLLTLKLFKDEIGATVRAIGGLFACAFLRLAHAIPPLLVLIIPFVLLVAQFAMWYEWRPLRPAPEGAARYELATDQHTLLTAELRPEDWPLAEQLRLTAPAGVRIDLPKPDEDGRARGHRDPEKHTLAWRLVAVDATDGTPNLQLHLPDGTVVEKQIVVSTDPHAMQFTSPRRAGPGFWDRVLYPGEPAFAADSPIRSIALSYPTRSTEIFGLDVHWIITFLVVSILGALLLKPFVKVQF